VQKCEDKIEKDAERDSAAQDVIDDHLISPSVTSGKIESGRDEGGGGDNNEKKIEHEASSKIVGHCQRERFPAHRYDME